MPYCKVKDCLNPRTARLLKLFHRWARKNVSLLIGDISKSEFGILMMLRHADVILENQPMTISTLAENFEVTAPAISRMVGSLEARGLVRREKKEKDRRNIYVCLTSLGDEKCLLAEKNADDFLQEVISHMEPEDYDIMLDKMEKFHDAMDLVVSERVRNNK